MTKYGYVWNIDLETLNRYTSESFTYKELCEKIGMPTFGNSLRALQKRLKTENIDTSHFDQYKFCRGKKSQQSLAIEDCLILNPKCSNTTIRSKMLEYKVLEYKCKECGLVDNWNDKFITLELDHINGNNKDNRIENLRWLCPNCHSQTITFRNKSGLSNNCTICTKIIRCGKVRCNECKNIVTEKELEAKIKNRKVTRPPYDSLINDVNTIGYVATGKKYGVSDNAIRKWIKYYEKYENKELESC